MPAVHLLRRDPAATTTPWLETDSSGPPSAPSASPTTFTGGGVQAQVQATPAPTSSDVGADDAEGDASPTSTSSPAADNGDDVATSLNQGQGDAAVTSTTSTAGAPLSSASATPSTSAAFSLSTSLPTDPRRTVTHFATAPLLSWTSSPSSSSPLPTVQVLHHHLPAIPFHLSPGAFALALVSLFLALGLLGTLFVCASRRWSSRRRARQRGEATKSFWGGAKVGTASPTVEQQEEKMPPPPQIPSLVFTQRSGGSGRAKECYEKAETCVRFAPEPPREGLAIAVRCTSARSLESDASSLYPTTTEEAYAVQHAYPVEVAYPTAEAYPVEEGVPPCYSPSIDQPQPEPDEQGIAYQPAPPSPSFASLPVSCSTSIPTGLAFPLPPMTQHLMPPACVPFASPTPDRSPQLMLDLPNQSPLQIPFQRAAPGGRRASVLFPASPASGFPATPSMLNGVDSPGLGRGGRSPFVGMQGADSPGLGRGRGRFPNPC